MGVSGRAILGALIAGHADPATMAELAKGRRRKLPLLEQALTGLMRAHYRQLLTMQLAHIDVLDEQIETLGAEITHRLRDLRTGEPPAMPADGAGHARRPPDLCPRRHPARPHPWGRSTWGGTASGRMGHQHGPLWHGRTPGRLERRGPWP
jgi:hypothetical protein